MSRGRGVLVAVAAGLGAGLAARLLFAVLPDPWSTLANTSALWGLVPFLVGYGLRAHGRLSVVLGVVLGVMSLATMVLSWAMLSPTPATPRELIMWAMIALLAGAACGLAGGLGRSVHPWPHRLSLAFIGGLVTGEGLYGILVIGGPQWWFELVVGLALPLALARRWPDRLIAVAGVSAIACALFAAYLLYDAIAVAG